MMATVINPENTSPSVVTTSLDLPTHIVRKSQSVDVIAKAVHSITDETALEDESEMIPGNIILGRLNEHVSRVSLTTATAEDTTGLAIADVPTDIHHQYQPIIYVNQGDSHMAVPAEHSILLGADSHNASLQLDQTDFSTLSPQEVESHAIHQVGGDGEGTTILQTLPHGIDSTKLISVSPMVQPYNGATDDQAATCIPTVIDGSTLQTIMVKTPSGDMMQVLAVQNLADLNKSGNRQLLQMLPLGDGGLSSGLVLQGNTPTLLGKSEGEDLESGVTQVLDMGSGIHLSDSLTGILVSAPVVQRVLPPGAPVWASRLNDCEQIGDSFRGWVETEIDLDLLLTYHKQQTTSLWGTRQSPSPAKPSTRLMWKSQYVPFDGIPFINAGSRAIVLECQYGPRRRGAQARKQTELHNRGEFKQTCPARIYIKKVKKFPEFAVDINIDKKLLKIAMDQAFLSLREQGFAGHGQERYYVQMPTEGAHEFHSEAIESPHRLHPGVAKKIRELVSCGETRLYAIRKALRRFVEKELFNSAEMVPEKHNLTYYPTVNDLQNHIHCAVLDIENGYLSVNASTVKVEVVADDSSSEDGHEEATNFPLWQQLSTADGQPHTESVTVTLTQNPGEDGQHVISKVETHLSDGTTQIATNLTPETARLLSKLHPNMFAENVPPEAGGATSLTSIQEDGQDTILPLTDPTQGQYVVLDTGQSVDDSITLGDVSPELSPDLEQEMIGLKSPGSPSMNEAMDTEECSSVLDDGSHVIDSYDSVAMVSEDIGVPSDIGLALDSHETHALSIPGGQ